MLFVGRFYELVVSDYFLENTKKSIIRFLGQQLILPSENQREMCTHTLIQIFPLELVVASCLKCMTDNS